MTKKCILFDLDGTLIDTAPDFIRIINHLCQKYGHTPPSDDAIRSVVSAGARAMVQLIFGERAAALADSDGVLLAYRQAFLDSYADNICVDSCLFAGLDEFLASLEKQGIAWGIVTNKPRYLASDLLDKLKLSERCAVLVCPDDVAHTKPDPEPLFLACTQLGKQPSDCLYVGDHPRDIEAGKRAGMATLIAGFGYIPPDASTLDEWGADGIAMSVDELIDMCRTWLGDVEIAHV